MKKSHFVQISSQSDVRADPSAAARMGKLIDDLLQVVRLGRQATILQQVDLDELVEEVVGA